MRIQHNIMAMSAYRNYTNNVSAMKKNLEKLSSGYKINRAGDDAAGLAISEKMRAQITGLETAQKNAKDGISLVQTAEGALTEVHDMLNRMVELATQSANGTYDDTTDRDQLQKEMNQLRSEIDRIADSSNFNGIKLLDGTIGMNSAAFTLKSEAAQDADTVSNFVKGILPKAANNSTGVAGTDTILHSDSVDAQIGGFKIDLSAVELGAASAANTQNSFKFTILGKEFSYTASAGASAGKALTGKDIGDAVVKQLTASGAKLVIKADGTVVSAKASGAGTGAVLFNVTNSNGILSFEMSGFIEKGKTAETAFSTNQATLNNQMKDLDDKVLAAFNTKDAVKISANGKGEVVNGENVGYLEVTNASKQQAGRLANTVMELDMSKIKDGSKLTIAGQEYTFAIGENSQNKKGTYIDLTDIVKDATDLNGTLSGSQKTEIMAKITNISNNTFTIGNKADEWGKITLEEKSNGQGTTNVNDKGILEKLKTEDGIKSLVSLESPATKAATTITGKDAEIKDGNSLVIGGKTYTFTKSGAGTNEIKVSDGMKGLYDKLKADNVTCTYDSAAGTIKVEEKSVTGRGLTLQIGDTADTYNQLNVTIKDTHCLSLGIDASKISIADQDSAAKAVDALKQAINYVSDVRGTLGATQNRLDHTINNLSVMTENIQDAESTIRDVDVAEEMMAYTKNNILIQSAQAMLAQANQVPQGVLQLLG